MDKHFEGYGSLQYMAVGAVELSYGGPRRRLEGRWFWPAYPGPRIAFQAAAGTRSWSHRYVAFQGPLLDGWLAAGFFPLDAQPAPPGQDWDWRLDTLLAEVRRGGKWGTLKAINQLEAILLLLAEERTGAASTEKPTWLEQVFQLLERSVDFDPDYTKIAADVGMAVSTLRRRFRAATGTPLHRYVLQQRVARARQLLGDTDLSIKAVASELGYRDVYFFSRQFADLVGVPPGTYRKGRQGERGIHQQATVHEEAEAPSRPL